MSVHVPPPWPVEGDAFDEVDAIEAKAEPAAADLARLDLLADHPSSLVRMMARSAAGPIRSRVAAAAPAQPAQAAPKPQAEHLLPAAEACSAARDHSDPAGEFDPGLMESTPAPGGKGTVQRTTPSDLPTEEEADEPPIVADAAGSPLLESPEQPITLTATTVAVNDTGFDAMAEGKFVSYLRVSTARQGASGLGLEAQRKAVADFLNGGRWTLVREFVEVESGKRTDRPKLAEAMALCRIHGATLVIAKIDRLSRNAAFLLSLRDAGVDFVAADLPNANRLTVGILSMVAEAERDAISARTKAALAAKAKWYEKATPEELAALKKRGKATQLGGVRKNSGQIHQQGAAASLAVRKAKASARATDLAPMIAELQAAGATSLAQIAAALTERGIPTSRGADRWSPTQVSRVMKAAERGA